MSLIQEPEPFDDWDWIYEIKHDGFRALAVIQQRQCRFFSRKKYKLSGHQGLRETLVKEREIHIFNVVGDFEKSNNSKGHHVRSMAYEERGQLRKHPVVRNSNASS